MDELVVIRERTAPERILCPKQGMIPHDMVHYAVESVMTDRGFLSRLAAGEGSGPGTRMTREGSAEAIERLVETLQAEVWSGPAPDGEVIDLYELACSVREHPALPLAPEDLGAIRDKMKTLERLWAAVPVHGSLDLVFAPAEETDLKLKARADALS
jgi:hypothetical protein